MILPTEHSLAAEDYAPAKLGEFENPLDFIWEDHRRERRICALIDKIATADPPDAASVGHVLRFLTKDLFAHMEDEHSGLFPLLLRRCKPEDEIQKIVGRLRTEHDCQAALAPGVEAALAHSLAEPRQLSDEQRAALSAFATHARRHLIAENAIVLPIARRRLTTDDLANLRRRMLEARGLMPGTETKYGG